VRSAVKSSEAKPWSSLAKTPAKRSIPVCIRRAVWARDGGRCAYQSKDGRRCGSRRAIEFHHRIPWARCKEHTIGNIALRCRAHNQYEAELDFGAAHMAQCRDEAQARRSRIAADLEEIGC
jgi:5-methylcytosine-specific restriction endonuclease McrA